MRRRNKDGSNGELGVKSRARWMNVEGEMFAFSISDVTVENKFGDHGSIKILENFQITIVNYSMYIPDT